MARATTIFVILVGLALPSWIGAEEATLGEAAEVAARYLEYLDDRFASWGTEASPTIATVEELRSGGRLLGWVFHVEPEGFLIVSRHKELAAVKAWSAEGRFETAANEGLPSLVKERMAASIHAVETLSGKAIESMESADWAVVSKLNFLQSWTHVPSPNDRKNAKAGGTAGMDYEEGEALLSTNWSQGDPFNRLTPPGYGFDGDGNLVVLCDHTLVGCVATAGVQLMRYWSWPPAAADGTYVDRYWWTHMPDNVDASSPQEQIDAVSEISYNVAVAVNMDFGCAGYGGSGAQTADMVDVYENRRYHTGADIIDRWNLMQGFVYTPEEWFELMKAQYNVNRPVQYKVDGHSTVGDGWYEDEAGGVTQRWYHFNYGWSTADNTWYLLDVIPLGIPEVEYMVVDLRPDLAMGTSISGLYPTEWLSANHFDRPSRYFDRDVTGSSAEFEAGQGLQYLRPGFWVRNTGTTATDEILFQGTPTAITEFYHEAPYGDVKIRIHDGELVIRAGGEMALY